MLLNFCIAEAISAGSTSSDGAVSAIERLRVDRRNSGVSSADMLVLDQN